MKVTLISTHTHPVALGLRYISSYLKSSGHDVELIFMSSRRDTVEADFSPTSLEHLIERVRDRDLIGLSLLTNNFHRARVLTQHLRNTGKPKPIIWGGTHPTLAPDESLEFADAICLGEGEEPLLQLLERLQAGRDPLAIESLWFAAGGRFGNRNAIRNRCAQLQSNLDDFPFPDYDLDTHWISHKDGLARPRPNSLRGTMQMFRVLTSRGCPYHCSFCNNAALRNLFKDCGQWVRLRSLDNVLAELRQALQCFPTITKFNFVDDLFFVRSEAQIEEFATKYKQQINLPLQLDAFPNTVTARKVEALSKVPIELVSMGIESASADTLANIYHRPTAPSKIAEAINLFKKYGLRTEYHYIVNNPYEPDANEIETMRFIADHHRGPAVLRVFPLQFYPGTPLHARALSDGLIQPREHSAYKHIGTGAREFAGYDYHAIWLRIVLSLRNIGLPCFLAHRLIDLVTSSYFRKAFDRSWFYPAVFVCYQLFRKVVRNIFIQPFVQPLKYLRRGRNSATMGSVAHGTTPPPRWTVPSLNINALQLRHPEQTDREKEFHGQQHLPIT